MKTDLPPRLTYIRPSAASIWIKCSAAPREVANRIAGLDNPNAFSAGSDPSREGQLGHRAIELMLSGEELTESRVRGLCLEFGVAFEEAEWMVRFGQRAIKGMPFRSSGWQFLLEEPVKADLHQDIPAMTGTTDLLAYKQTDPGKYELGIIDWKFGRNEVAAPDKNFQVWCYAVMAAESFNLGFLERSRIERVHAQIRYPRLGHNTRIVTFERSDLDAMKQALATAISKCYAPNPEYRTGAHCEFCSAQSTCPAVNKALATFSDSLVPTDGMPVKPVREMTTAEVGRVLGVSRLVKRWAAVIESQVKRFVDDHGPVALPDGRVYGKKTRCSKSIDLSAPGAWDVLEPMCGTKALLENVKISQTAAKSAAAEKYLADRGKARFGRGERKQLEEELIEALDENGAIVEKETTVYSFSMPDK